MRYEIQLAGEHVARGPVTVTLDVSGDPAAAIALTEGTPFPGDVTIGSGALSVATGAVGLLGPDGEATFRAEGFGAFGTRKAGREALGLLRLPVDLAEALELPENPQRVFAVLGWGFDAAASARGSIAFGAPSASLGFNVEASAEGRFAVLRSFPSRAESTTVVDGTFAAWRLPKQIDGTDRIPRGTWLVTELSGELGLGLEARVGYEFNWLREARDAGGLLEGTLGLRVEAGLRAAVGMRLEGRFALIVSRGPDADLVRARLLKRSVRGWNFALGLVASVDGALDPPSYDDLVKAVLGTHHQEYLDALAVVSEWTDPDVDLSDRVAGLTSGYLQELARLVTGFDPTTGFESAREALLELIDRWKTLPQRVSEIIWAYVPVMDELEAVRELVDRWSTMTRDELRADLASRLTGIDFLQGPLGRLLSAHFDDLLSLLDDDARLTGLRTLVGQVRSILDGADVEARLSRLHGVVSERLGLAAIEKAVEDDSLESLDRWVQARLGRFLGEELRPESLEKIGLAVRRVRELARGVYEKTVVALNKEYTAELAYAYARATSEQALLDAEFDLGTPAAGEAYRQLLEGHLDDILTRKIPGVQLHQGTLSHGIRRTRSLEISLPFASMREESMNEAVARLDAVDEDEGRLLVYGLDARDVVTGRHVRTSALSLTAEIPRLDGVARWGRGRSRLTYAFRQAVREMKATHMRQQIGSYGSAYLHGAFAGGQDWNTWVTALDQLIERKTRNGDETFGNTLLALELSAPGSVASAWLEAPGEENHPVYMRMSRALQAKLKELIPFHYFADPFHYVGSRVDVRAERRLASALMLYAALPPTNSFDVKDGRVRPTDEDVYWNPDVVFSSDHHPRLDALLREEQTTRRLAGLMQRASDELRSTAGLPGGRDLSEHADSYRPDHDRMRDVVRSGLPKGIRPGSASYERGLLYLLELEETLVRGAQRAALRIAEFNTLAGERPADAIRALARFGADVTRTFHEEVESHYGGEALRPLGQLLFAEVAGALGGAAVAPPSAALEVFVIEDGAEFPAAAWLEGVRPTEHIVVAERLVAP